MGNTSERGAVRVAPAAQSPVGDRYDYADAFEIRLKAPDERPAEEWMRCGLERAPLPLRWTILVAHRFALRFHLGARSSPDHVLGWQVVTSEPDLAHLRASGPLMRGDLVARRDHPDEMVLLSYLTFSRPLPARLIWAAVGPIHRRIAPYLLERAAEAGAPDRTGSS